MTLNLYEEFVQINYKCLYSLISLYSSLQVALFDTVKFPNPDLENKLEDYILFQYFLNCNFVNVC